MTTDIISTLLLVNEGCNKYSSTFPFKCAAFWAEQGCKVLYISLAPLTSLPPGIGNAKEYDSHIFSNIKFMYLPRWQDLLQYLYGIQRQNITPTMIIVEQLDHYLFEGQNIKENADSHAALLCASLMDAARVCARKSKSLQKTQLIVSVGDDNLSVIKVIVNHFLTGNVYLVKEVSGDTAEVKVSLTSFSSFTHKKLHFNFTLDSKDATLVLKNIFEIKEEINN